MNRYYWFAIILVIVGITSIVAIWLVDVSDPELQKKIELTLGVVGAIGTVSSIGFAIFGAVAKKRARSVTAPPPAQRGPAAPPSELLGHDESVAQYLSNLEASLDEYGTTRSRFVELSVELGPSPEAKDIELLQSFEWANQDWQCGTPTVTRQPIGLLHAHERFRRYVLLGDPGSGKTTCLHYLTLSLIAKYRGGSSRLLPFYVRLSDWRERRTSALEFLRSSFARIAGPNSYLTKEFEALLSQGELLIILDGLNEVPGRRYYHQEKQRHLADPTEILSEVSTGEAFRSKQDPRERSLRELAASAAVRTHFIVSCRTHEFFGSPSWQEIYVLPMSEDQIHLFLQKYMGEEAKELEAVLESNEALKSLAKNPFFLRSMTRVFSPNLSLVRNKGQFLEYLCKELLAREQSRGIIFKPQEVMRIVGRLAFRMLKRDMIGSQVELRGLGRRHQSTMNVLIGTGLVVPRGEGKVSFYHQIIQEFFAAFALREKYMRCHLERLLCHKKWSEVILLWHDIDAKSRILTRLLLALNLRNKPWTRPFSTPPKLVLLYPVALVIYVFVITNLVLDLILPGSFLLSKLVAHPVQFLIFAFVIPMSIRYAWLFISYHREAIANASYVLGQIGNPIAINHLPSAFRRVGRASTRCTEVAKALARFGEKAMPNLISELSSESHLIRAGCIEALGLIGELQAVDSLLGVLKEGNMKLIKPTIEALGRIGDPRAGPAIAEILLLTEPEFISETRYASVAPTLRRFHKFDAALFQVLRQVVSKEQPRSCRYLGIQAIAGYGHPEGLPLLHEIARDNNEPLRLRASATQGLSLIRAAGAVEALIELYERVPDLESAAVEALGNVRQLEALPALYQALNHEAWQIRQAAVESLCLIGDLRSELELQRMCTDENKNVRKEVARAFGVIGGIDAVDPLQRLCRDAEHDVRVAALESLDFTFPEVARPTLIELAADKTHPDRTKVIELLAYYRFPDSRDVLLDLCADVDEEVREQATKSLRRIDQSLADELLCVSSTIRRRLVRKSLAYLGRKFNVDETVRLVHQARISGVSDQAVGGWVVQQILKDSELKRKFRLVFIAALILSAGICCVLPGVLTAVITRAASFASAALWRIKWISLSLIGAAVISFLPGVRRGRQVKVLSAVYKVIRLLGFAMLFFLVVGAILRYWYILLLLAFVTMGVLLAIRKRIASAVKKFTLRFWDWHYEQIPVPVSSLLHTIGLWKDENDWSSVDWPAKGKFER